MATQFFDYLNSITLNKKDLMQTAEDEKAYVPFMINRGLSMGIDTVMYANLANKSHGLSRRMQYDMLRTAIRPGKRFNKWAKEEKLDDLPFIISYFKVGRREALQYMKILSDEQLQELKDRADKGGRE